MGCILGLFSSIFNLIFAVIYFFLGWWSIGVLLWLIWRTTAPFWIEIVAGILLGSVTVPLAIIGLLLQLAGVIHPPLVR